MIRALRHQCDVHGCYQKKHTVKLGYFDDCFPGNIGMGDVDGRVEMYGNFLELEWKCKKIIRTGQDIAFKNLTKHGFTTVFMVVGDAEVMSVSDICFYSGGVRSEWRQCDLDGLKGYIRKWVAKYGRIRSAGRDELVIGGLKTELVKEREKNAMLMREYLVEVSGRFMDMGWPVDDADKEASLMAKEKFGIDVEFSRGILKRIA